MSSGDAVRPPARPRATGRVEFREDADGDLFVEVHPTIPIDLTAGGVGQSAAEEIAANGGSLSIEGRIDADGNDQWCFPIVAACVMLGLNARFEKRLLNLGDTDGQRQLAIRLIGQGSIRFVWPREGFEHRHEMTENVRSLCFGSRR